MPSMALDVYREGIELVARGELIVSQFYTLFAEQFPEYAPFWSTLTTDEQKHARWFQEFLQFRIDRKHDLPEYLPVLLRATVDALEDSVLEAAVMALTLRQGLEIALRAELIFCAHLPSELLRAAPVEAQPTLKIIGEEEQRHRQRLQALLALQ